MAKNTAAVPAKTTGNTYAATEFEIVRGFVDEPAAGGTTFDDSGTITVDHTEEFSTIRTVTGSTHTLTFATTGNVQANYYKVMYTFDVDCTLTLTNLKDNESTLGTVNPIPAGTYPFFIFPALDGTLALVIQNNTVGAGPSYDAAALALFIRMATAGAEPDLSRKALINNLIITLKADGNWALMDCLQIYAAHSQLVYMLNWKADEFNGAEIGTPSFTTDNYFTASTGNVVNSNFNPSNGVQYTLNDAMFGTYIGVRDSSYTALKVLTGVNKTGAAAFVGSGATTGDLTGRINLTTPSMTATGIILADNKIYSAIRTASAASELKENNTQIDTDTTAADGTPNDSFYVGGLNLDGSAGFESASQYRVFFAGKSTINLASIKTAFDTFFAAL